MTTHTLAATSGAPARVLFVHPSDELYGADVVLLNLLRGLDRKRFEPLVVVANDLPYEGLLSRELAASGIACRKLPIAVARRAYLSPRGLPAFAVRLRRSVALLRRIIEEERIVLVVSNTLAIWPGALAARRTGRRHLWYVHELIERPKPLAVSLRRFVPAYSDRIVCVSQAARDSLLRTPHARAQALVLANGVAPAAWLAGHGRDEVRRELGCAPDDVVIGMIGRISPLKAPDVFVRAAMTLQRAHSHPHLRFVLAGDTVPGQTHYLDAIKRLIAATPTPDRIHLLGYRRDIPKITNALDLLVVPTRGPESFSLVAVQAMLAGEPVVATDAGAMRETISHGETGILVPPDDASALADALAALVGDAALRARMGAAGRVRALERFTLDRQIAAFNRILADTLFSDTGAVLKRSDVMPVSAGTY